MIVNTFIISKGDVNMSEKIKGSVVLHLEPNQFCRVWEHTAKDCAFGTHVIADADHYNLLYQNGKFLGLVQPDGGVIYPFSENPYKKGSLFKHGKIKSAKVVCISSAYNLNMSWGTVSAMLMYDRDGTPCYLGASGMLYLELNPGDGGRNADCLYRKLFSQEASDRMTVDAVRNKLKPAFIEVIGAEIQDHLENMNRPLAELKGLTPKEKLEVSKSAYENLKDFFETEYGLTLTKANQKSIVSNLVVRKDAEEEAREGVGAPAPQISPWMLF